MIRGRRHAGLGAIVAALALVSAGCFSFDEPTNPPATTLATLPPTAAPRDPNQLVVAVPNDPSGFLPPATDDTTQLLVDLLYDPLYRLDDHLAPQPELASGQPSVSSDGTTWTIPLRDGPRFADGSRVTAPDVAFSLKLAASPDCPFGRDLCDTTSANLASVAAPDRSTVVVTLDAPFSPFLGEVLAQIPILSEIDVRAATQGLLTSAASVAPGAPGQEVKTITDATQADACLADSPPFGCHLADYTAQLEKMLGQAGIALPPHARFTGLTGTFDGEAYAGALLDQVAALDQLLTGTGTDQQAAALPLIDLTRRSLGSGAFIVDSYQPGVSLSLKANPGHAGGAPGISRVLLRVVTDPATAATNLLTGDVDWVLGVSSDQVTGIRTAQNIELGDRPLPSERAIVFNLRPGHIYADAATRQAFALCLDRSSLAAAAAAGGGTAALATTPVASGSWAMTAPPSAARDVNAAVAKLQKAGWTRGSDGIFVRNGQRLASSVAVRPSRADLLAFAQGAAKELADCGIELDVEQLDLTGDQLLSQLQWPNDFDTVLVTQALGEDPDQDLQAFESSHATSADNPADANPGGYSSVAADRMIAAGRLTTDRAARQQAYAQVQAVIASDLPAWPIWYDTAWSALSTRVRSGGGTIDPSAPRYWWDMASWTLGSSPQTSPRP